MTHIRYAVAAVLLAASPISALAATDGGIWDGTQHEPAPGATLDHEKAAGIAPSSQQQRRTTDDLEQMDRTLTKKSETMRRTPPP